MIDGTRGFRGLDDPRGSLLRVGRFLRAAAVSTILVNETHAITGNFQATEDRTSNLADNIVFLRHIEYCGEVGKVIGTYRGEVEKVIGTVKMRTSDFERTLRELEITADGIQIGDPLQQLCGILTGTPAWEPTAEEREGQ